MASGSHPCTEQFRPSHCCLLESLLEACRLDGKLHLKKTESYESIHA